MPLASTFQTLEVLNGLRGLKLGHPLYLFQTIGSTNDEAKRLAEAGGPEGLLVLAEEQTAGRGRLGRRWHTQAGANLAFSLLMRPALPAAHASRLTMLAGVAVCEAIEMQLHLLTSLKWPNDIILAGYKVGGILVEGAVHSNQLDYAVLGIGLNVNWAPDLEPGAYPTTSLAAIMGQSVNRLLLLRQILAQLETHRPDLTTGVLLTDWQARLTMMGDAIRVRTAEGVWHGWLHAVADDGTLTLRLETGELRQVTAGDVLNHSPESQH